MPDDTPKKTADPFAELAAPAPRKRVDRKAIAEAGESLGFEAPPKKEAPKAKAPKPVVKKEKAHKPVAPKVNRLRSKAAEPTVPFSQRVTAETANGFYDYAREHDLKMKEVLERAYKALRASETKT